MSTALVLSLRENCGYLQDAGYRQTSQLMATAADEIERLHLQLARMSEAQMPAPMTNGIIRRVRGSVRSFRSAQRLAGSTPRELGT
jgi:hypothetical protein